MTRDGVPPITVTRVTTADGVPPITATRAR